MGHIPNQYKNTKNLKFEFLGKWFNYIFTMTHIFDQNNKDASQHQSYNIVVIIF